MGRNHLLMVISGSLQVFRYSCMKGSQSIYSRTERFQRYVHNDWSHALRPVLLRRATSIIWLRSYWPSGWSEASPGWKRRLGSLFPVMEWSQRTELPHCFLRFHLTFFQIYRSFAVIYPSHWQSWQPRIWSLLWQSRQYWRQFGNR